MVTDMVSILASIGGALGLCLGFSIWGGFNTGPLVHPCHCVGTQRGFSEHDAVSSGLNSLGAFANRLKKKGNDKVMPVTYSVRGD